MALIFKLQKKDDEEKLIALATFFLSPAPTLQRQSWGSVHDKLELLSRTNFNGISHRLNHKSSIALKTTMCTDGPTFPSPQWHDVARRMEQHHHHCRRRVISCKLWVVANFNLSSWDTQCDHNMYKRRKEEERKEMKIMFRGCEHSQTIARNVKADTMSMLTISFTTRQPSPLRLRHRQPFSPQQPFPLEKKTPRNRYRIEEGDKKRYGMTRSLSDRVEGKLNYVCNIEWLNGTINILFLIKSDFRSHFDFAVHLIAQRIHPIVSIPLTMSRFSVA